MSDEVVIMEKIFECKLCGDGAITCTLKVYGSFHNQEPPDICPYISFAPFKAEWKVIQTKDCSTCINFSALFGCTYGFDITDTRYCYDSKKKENPCYICGAIIKEQSRCIPNCKEYETLCSECYYDCRTVENGYVKMWCSKGGSSKPYSKCCPEFIKR